MLDQDQHLDGPVPFMLDQDQHPDGLPFMLDQDQHPDGLLDQGQHPDGCSRTLNSINGCEDATQAGSGSVHTGSSLEVVVIPLECKPAKEKGCNPSCKTSVAIPATKKQDELSLLGLVPGLPKTWASEHLDDQRPCPGEYVQGLRHLHKGAGYQPGPGSMTKSAWDAETVKESHCARHFLVCTTCFTIIKSQQWDAIVSHEKQPQHKLYWYYNQLTSPSGWHRDNFDDYVKSFRKSHGRLLLKLRQKPEAWREAALKRMLKEIVEIEERNRGFGRLGKNSVPFVMLLLHELRGDHQLTGMRDFG
jgi:hypothetical protein